MSTLIGRLGAAVTLSGGQRQRLGIARAVIRDDPILILDEPTALLDAESEQLVIEAMERLMTGRTVICIARRLSTMRHGNKIIVIKDGVVAEEGAHHELMRSMGAGGGTRTLFSYLHILPSGIASSEKTSL